MVLVECSPGDLPQGTPSGEEYSSLAAGRLAVRAGDEFITRSAESAGVEAAANVTRASTDVPPVQNTVSNDAPSGWRPEDWIKTSGSATSKWLGISIGLVAGGTLALGLIGFGLARWSTRPRHVSNPRGVDPAAAMMDESTEGTNSVSQEAFADISTGIPSIIDPVSASDERIAFSQPPRGDTRSESTAQVESTTAVPVNNTNAEPFHADEVHPPGFELRGNTTGQRKEKTPLSFGDLASLLEEPVAATVSTELPSASVDDADESVPPPAAADGSAVSQSSSNIARAMDVSARVKEKLRAVHFDKVPLIDFVRSVMRLSGVSVQIDPAALQQTGRDVESAVTYVASDVTVDQLIHRALEPLSLTPIVEGQLIRISSPFWEESQLRQMSFFIGDLHKGKGSELDLPSVISKLIEPDSWSEFGGLGSIRGTGELLQVSQTRRIQFQVLILLEKLRLARGLSPQSKIPARYVLLDSRWSQLHQRLARPIDMNAWHPQPFLDVVMQLEEASELRILVDWQALAGLDWTQGSTCTLVARKTSVDEVFDRLLSPGELELRPINDATVQITTAGANAERPYLEFYSLEELGESGLARLEESMHTRVGSFALDTVSDTALVVLPASEHRELHGR